MTEWRIVRGCGTLPHVGGHPGTPILVLLIVLGGVAGLMRGGLIAAAGGLLFMALVFGPMYLVGAYSRAKISDRLSSTPPTAEGRE